VHVLEPGRADVVEGDGQRPGEIAHHVLSGALDLLDLEQQVLAHARGRVSGDLGHLEVLRLVLEDPGSDRRR
jgi:hypothetical protein